MEQKDRWEKKKLQGEALFSMAVKGKMATDAQDPMAIREMAILPKANWIISDQ